MSRGCQGSCVEGVSRVSRVKLCVSVVECRALDVEVLLGWSRVVSRGCRGGVEGVLRVSRVCQGWGGVAVRGSDHMLGRQASKRVSSFTLENQADLKMIER